MSKSRGARQSPLRERKPSLAARILQGKGVKDESLDLFSWLKKSPNSAPTSKNNVTGQPGGVQGKIKRMANGKSGTDDLLSPEVGKNEFNWLMTPPVSPRNSNAQQSSSSTAPKEKGSSPKVKPRSVSASRPSRLSQETNNTSTVPTKMTRSSSVTRSAVLTNSLSSNASVRRPSVPKTIARSPSSGSLSANRSSPNGVKSSTTTSPAARARPGSSRPPSPAKTRNPKPTQNLIPDKPNLSLIGNSQLPKTAASPRPLTPPRRAVSSPAQATVNTVNRSLARSPSQDIKKVIKAGKPPERSVSNVGQRLIGARQNASVNQRPATSPVTTPKRSMARSQFGDNLAKSRLGITTAQSRKTGLPTDGKSMKTPVRQVLAANEQKPSIGRTRSNRSLEVNTKQTDTRQSGTDHQKPTIYPRSNSSRLPALKGRTEANTARSGVKIVPTDHDSTPSDRAVSEGGGSARLLSDVFESTRYDFLMKEDARNLSWLRGDDEMSLRCPSFHRFDLPPEPFAFGE